LVLRPGVAALRAGWGAAPAAGRVLQPAAGRHGAGPVAELVLLQQPAVPRARVADVALHGSVQRCVERLVAHVVHRVCVQRVSAVRVEA
jgi:hypothetical protein